MDLLQRLNGAIEYIESSLSDEVDFDRVAQIACCSANHFQRMFSFMTGITLTEYIRRRRLTLAALELQNSNIKVIDVALKYCYDSPDSFARAFQRMHGITPSSAREAGVTLKSFPKMIFCITLKGETAMNYKIVEKESFELIGKGIIVTMDTVGVKAPAFWQQCSADHTLKELQDLTHGEESYGVTCYQHDKGSEFWSYHIAYKNNSDVKECNYERLQIPALTWVVFESKEPQPQAILHLWEAAYSEWFPSSGYTDLGGPEMEVYYPDKCELWISVKKV